MAKRLTLYIQDDEVVRKLDLVLNKSELVTSLLRQFFLEAEDNVKEQQIDEGIKGDTWAK